jgi:hypothetical protein
MDEVTNRGIQSKLLVEYAEPDTAEVAEDDAAVPPSNRRNRRAAAGLPVTDTDAE